MTHLAVTEGMGRLNTQVKRDLAAATVDQMGDTPDSCGATSVSIPAKSETKAGMFMVLPSQFYAMPPTETTKLSPDKKSIIMTDGMGWTWTYTLTPVR